MYYWATMEPVDAEDSARIVRHLAERDGWGFQTIERGRNLLSALPQVDPAGTVLLDSVTALLANEMFYRKMDTAAPQRVTEDLLALSASVRNFVCVCDDIFRDAGVYDAWTERYRVGLARICRVLAHEFETVCEVTVGVPRVWKGNL